MQCSRVAPFVVLVARRYRRGYIPTVLLMLKYGVKVVIDDVEMVFSPLRAAISLKLLLAVA